MNPIRHLLIVLKLPFSFLIIVFLAHSFYLFYFVLLSSFLQMLSFLVSFLYVFVDIFQINSFLLFLLFLFFVSITSYLCFLKNLLQNLLIIILSCFNSFLNLIIMMSQFHLNLLRPNLYPHFFKIMFFCLLVMQTTTYFYNFQNLPLFYYPHFQRVQSNPHNIWLPQLHQYFLVI